ncbi:MAG TPA: PIF1 family DEAD/DEAH box helicase [Candidatus Paceibacterota bacterium]|nr:PIF1 family DEAD/DEAH box helicase [Candidatus Paceibacterota bacterium]
MTQEQALTILKTGANVFLTGEPGAGKTHTINQYVKHLREHGIEPAIAASTGIAATHIGGMTIHSWSGIGIKRQLTPYDLDHLASNEYVNKRMTRANVLIIDEISMLSADVLTMVDQATRAVRRVDMPFGGMQVVCVGDFFQLPPISAPGERPRFAFESRSWEELRPVICYLHEQHRQDDPAFLAVLSALRSNLLEESHRAHLLGRSGVHDDELQGVTRLFPHNVNVDQLNNAELSRLSSASTKYQMVGQGKEALVESLKKGCLSPEDLVLKEGAAVMFTKNNPAAGFANGTLGTVTGFEKETKYPIVRTHGGEKITAAPMEWAIEEEGKVKARISQVPLRLAWAITVHKSQGMSLDAAVMDLGAAFEYGQGYVALSRVRRLSGLYLVACNERALMVHPEILERDQDFRSESEAAERGFGEMDDADIKQMHDNFILSCGGTLEKKEKETSKLDKIRQKHAKAYARWTDEEEAELIGMFEAGQTPAAIAKALGRKPGAIMMRLVKLGLVEGDL